MQIILAILAMLIAFSVQGAEMAAVKIHSIQRAADLAAAAAGTSTEWGTATVQGSISIGHSQHLGSVSLLEPLGTVTPTGGTQSTVAWTDRTGEWVRIQLQDGTGPVHWFRIQSQQLTSFAAETGEPMEAISYDCVGLGIVLADRAPQGQKVKQGGNSAVIIQEPPTTINPQMGEGRIRPTYRSDATDGPVLSYDDGATEWLPISLLTWLANQWGAERSDGLECTISATSDAQTQLASMPQRWELAGISYLEAMSTVLNAARGLGFTVTLGAGGITVNVSLIGGKTVSYDSSGDITVSNRTGVALNLQSLNASSYSLSKGVGSQYDRIIVVGDPLWFTANLLLNGDQTNSDLLYGWDAALETDWNSADPDDSSAHVYRRYVLNPAWDGRQGGSVGDAVAIGAPTTRGAHPWNGDMSQVDADQSHGRMYSFADSLPLRAGVDYTATTPDDGDPAQQMRPMVMICYEASSGNYYTANDALGVEVEVLPDQSGDGIYLYPQDAAQAVKDWLDVDSNFIVITAGLQAPLSLSVSWDSGTSNPRTLVVHAPGATRGTLTPDTYLDADGTDTLFASVATTHTVDDGVDALRAVLAEAVLRHADPQWNITATLPGYDDSVSPGDYVTSVVTGGGTNISVSATVREVRYTPGARGGTHIICGPAMGRVKGAL